MQYHRISLEDRKQLVVGQLKQLESEHYQLSLIIEANLANAKDDPDVEEALRRNRLRQTVIEKAIANITARYGPLVKRAETEAQLRAAEALKKKKKKGGAAR